MIPFLLTSCSVTWQIRWSARSCFFFTFLVLFCKPNIPHIQLFYCHCRYRSNLDVTDNNTPYQQYALCNNHVSFILNWAYELLKQQFQQLLIVIFFQICSGLTCFVSKFVSLFVFYGLNKVFVIESLSFLQLKNLIAHWLALTTIFFRRNFQLTLLLDWQNN